MTPTPERTYEQTTILYPKICFECDEPANHRHHVVPASRGGKRIVWLCEPCHEKTHGYHSGHFALMRAGHKEKAKRGEFLGGHRIRRRYGMEIVEVRRGLKIRLQYRHVPEEQAVIRLIYDARNINPPLDTRIKGLPVPYVRIADFLNDAEIRTVDGGPWSRKVVRDLALRGPDPLPAADAKD